MSRTVAVIEAEIAAIKTENTNWMTDDVDKGLITALTNEKNQLQTGKAPQYSSHHKFHHVIFILIYPFYVFCFYIGVPTIGAVGKCCFIKLYKFCLYTLLIGIVDADEFVIFWKAICADNGIITGSIGDKTYLRLIGDAKWLKNVSQLYVRKCYSDLDKIITDNIDVKSMLLLGTTGIGKSLFLRWLISQIC